MNRICNIYVESKLQMEAVKFADQNILYKVALENVYDSKVAAIKRLNPDQLTKLAGDLKELNMN